MEFFVKIQVGSAFLIARLHSYHFNTLVDVEVLVFLMLAETPPLVVSDDLWVRRLRAVAASTAEGKSLISG